VNKLCISNFDFNVFGQQNSQNHIILPQNFGENNADIEQIWYVFSIPNLLFLISKIAETFIILAQNLRENNTDFEHKRYVFYSEFWYFYRAK
jgi:hypothetical protein